ncbi:MAG: metal ABC transporter substrate-binding protein [Sphaerochaetaceae bacterium]|nr:metal ABC transporter substrate-binding protein [Sphaerochaetaceae bacterium]
MKKIITVLLISTVLTGLLFAGARAETSENKIKVIATIFPQYDWVREIVGENSGKVEIILLEDSGVDLHSYQPTTEDIVKISSCDLFIYTGGDSDEMIEDILSKVDNPKRKVINLLESLGDLAVEEEHKEGMQEHEHEHEHEHEEMDEHVWLSLRNAVLLCREIEKNLSLLDPEHASSYSENCSSYIEKLNNLDKKYTEAVEKGGFKTLVFADRFPFRYMTEDYGLDYYAAFSGCSAESEASFETIIFLAEKVDTLGLKYVLTIENSDQKIAGAVIRATKTGDQKILAMNSMQSVTSAAIESGRTYLGTMEENLEVLSEALRK